METFALDAHTVFAHTDSLRADAGALKPLPHVPVPSGFPFEVFHAAYRTAIDAAERRAQQVRDEARRIAANMETTVYAADSVDGATSAGLGALL